MWQSCQRSLQGCGRRIHCQGSASVKSTHGTSATAHTSPTKQSTTKAFPASTLTETDTSSPITLTCTQSSLHEASRSLPKVPEPLLTECRLAALYQGLVCRLELLTHTTCSCNSLSNGLRCRLLRLLLLLLQHFHAALAAAAAGATTAAAAARRRRSRDGRCKGGKVSDAVWSNSPAAAAASTTTTTSLARPWRLA